MPPISCSGGNGSPVVRVVTRTPRTNRVPFVLSGLPWAIPVRNERLINNNSFSVLTSFLLPRLEGAQCLNLDPYSQAGVFLCINFKCHCLFKSLIGFLEQKM